MILLAVVVASLSQDPGPIDAGWLPGRGRVRVEAVGSRLAVSIGDERQELELPGAPRLLGACAGPWMGDAGIVIALALEEEGGEASYRYVLSRETPFRRLVIWSTDLATGSEGWFLSKPVFTSTGEPYRIVDVHNPGGQDGLEITFRRGWPSLAEAEARVDEKILYDNCGGYWPEPLRAGGAMLYDVTGVRSAR